MGVWTSWGVSSWGVCVWTSWDGCVDKLRGLAGMCVRGLARVGVWTSWGGCVWTSWGGD